ncbi:MAG: ribonuclease HII [Oscillospiraceae bacterium]
MNSNTEIMNNYSYETKAMEKGYKLICGVDEAGRGPLAGAVYAAAVILNPDDIIEGLDDSKKLSEKKRNQLFDEIKNRAIAYCVAFATEKEIDEINILNGTKLAMKRAVEGLKIKADYALVDGNMLPDFSIDGEFIIKGDSLSASISAASILAKVSRDNYMTELAEKYPQYDFEKHKGYATKAHYIKILKYGISDCHRLSFLKNIEEKRQKFEKELCDD